MLNVCNSSQIPPLEALSLVTLPSGTTARQGAMREGAGREVDQAWRLALWQPRAATRLVRGSRE